jgi:hypothetical protein
MPKKATKAEKEQALRMEQLEAIVEKQQNDIAASAQRVLDQHNVILRLQARNLSQSASNPQSNRPSAGVEEGLGEMRHPQEDQRDTLRSQVIGPSGGDGDENMDGDGGDTPNYD